VKKKLAYFIGIICILCAMLWIWLASVDHKHGHFPIRRVIVEGVYWQIPQQQLEKMIAPYVEQGYFFANLFSLQRNLQNELPWLQTVSVSRQWPDKIVVVLQQKVAIAMLNNNSLLSQAGIVFSPPINSFPPDLPILLGPKEKAGDILKNYQVFTSIADSVNLSVIQVDLSTEGNWSVKLNNKIVVMLGEDDILPKFKRFCTVYQQVFVPQHREPSYVDMRYSHGMAVNWKN